eukprot:TRINITY_DN982_c0_g1_i21.p1 TRINITY_DN982_c0_g1~~TRINITY_DN982_c0_g1_i21.p1  ORF type:complete len:791 (+),score=165.29 TRINITY_DN982_c0_g1_i21:152-2524(+)
MLENVFAKERSKGRSKWMFPLFSIAFACLLYFFLWLIYSPQSGTYKFKNIYGEAYITYDGTYGIPYISGTTNNAIAFAIGYSQAADRLYDLSLHRAMAAGRLAEYFGKEALDFDRYMRSLQLSKVTARELQLLSTQNMTFLQAYTDGINEYAKRLLVQPIELLLSGISFEPWSIQDSLMIFKMFSFSLSEHWKLTALRTVIAHKWGKQLAERLVPFKDVTNGLFESIAAIDPSDIPLNKIDLRLKYEQVRDTSFEPVADPGIDFKFLKSLRFRGKIDWTGSSAWAVHKSKSANGKTLFSASINGAHAIPSELYIMSIKYPQGPNLMGATMAGFPLILFGRNEHVGWSMATSFVENIDLYSVKVTTDLRQYHYSGGWKNLEVSEEFIKVKGKKGVNYTVYRTHHGPIITSIKRYTTPYHSPALAIAWKGFSETDRSVAGMFRLNWARTTADLTDALKTFDGLAATFTFSTESGDIGLWTTGRIPVRKSIRDSLYIRNGQSPENDWREFYGGEDNPHVVNPRSGYISGCSGRVNPLNEAFHGIATTVPASSQALRSHKLIASILKRSKELDRSHLEIIQNDVADLFAESILGKLLAIVEKHKAFYYHSDSEEDKAMKRVLGVMPSWTSEMKSDSKYALLYSMWHKELSEMMLHKYFVDEGEQRFAAENFFSDYFLGSLVNNWVEGKELDSEYCENSQNKGKQNKCVHNVVEALVRAHKKIVEKYNSARNWKWGYENPVDFPHLHLSSCCLLKFLYHRRVLASVLLPPYIRETHVLCVDTLSLIHISEPTRPY